MSRRALLAPIGCLGASSLTPRGEAADAPVANPLMVVCDGKLWRCHAETSRACTFVIVSACRAGSVSCLLPSLVGLHARAASLPSILVQTPRRLEAIGLFHILDTPGEQGVPLVAVRLSFVSQGPA